MTPATLYKFATRILPTLDSRVPKCKFFDGSRMSMGDIKGINSRIYSNSIYWNNTMNIT